MALTSIGGARVHVDADLLVYSFGFGHGPAPSADLVVDLSDWFADPYVTPELRVLNGYDHRVIGSVLSTPGAATFVDRVFDLVAALVRLRKGAVIVAVGCVGGRHRSAVVADQLAFRVRSAGWTAEVIHRDIDRPVLHRRT